MSNVIQLGQKGQPVVVQEGMNLRAEAIRRLQAAGLNGLTWKEFDALAGVGNHGRSTGALSNLHKEQKIARLTERRDWCAVYVSLGYVHGRATEKQGSRNATITSELAEALRTLVGEECVEHRLFGIYRDQRVVENC